MTAPDQSDQHFNQTRFTLMSKNTYGPRAFMLTAALSVLAASAAHAGSLPSAKADQRHHASGNQQRGGHMGTQHRGSHKGAPIQARPGLMPPKIICSPYCAAAAH